MRRRFTVLFTFALVFGAAACGGEDEQLQPGEEPDPPQPVQEPEPPQPTQVEPRDGTVGDDVQGYQGGPEPPIRSPRVISL